MTINLAVSPLLSSVQNQKLSNNAVKSFSIFDSISALGGVIFKASLNYN